MKKYLVPFFVLAILTAAVYGWTLNYPFVFDDFNVILHNTAIRSISNVPKFFSTLGMAGPDDTAGLYRPIVFTTYFINYFLGGVEPINYRIFDLALHLFNSFLLFLIIVEIQQSTGRENRFQAIFFPALFCVHPVLTQSVIYLSARSVLVMTFFCLLSLYFLLRSLQRKGNIEKIISVFFFGCALLSKESSLPFIAVLFIVTYNHNRKIGQGLKETVTYLSPSIAIGIVFIFFRTYIIRSLSNTLIVGNATEYWRAEVAAIPRYLLLILDPFGLSIDHYVAVPRITNGFFLAGIVLIIAFVLVSYYLSRKDLLLLTFFVWPVLAMLAEFVIPLPERMVEYRLYLPMAGLALFLAAAAGKMKLDTSRLVLRTGVVILVLMLAILGVLSFEQQKKWESRGSIWENAIAHNRIHPRPYNNYGLYLMETGDYPEAIIYFSIAIKLKPDYDDAYTNLGLAYAKAGDLEKGREMAEKGVSLNPRSIKGCINLGKIYNAMGSRTDAVKMLRKAISLDAEDSDTYYVFAESFLGSGDFTQGYATLNEMIMKCPNPGQSRSRAFELLKKYGQPELASRLMGIS